MNQFKSLVYGFVTVGITSFSLSAVILSNPEASWANSTKFKCEKKGKNDYITYAVNTDGRRTPMIRWNSDYFSPEWKPEKRCSDVSRRFQRGYDNGTLRTIITGKINGYPVVCGVPSTSDTCNRNNMLFTLKRGANAKQAVEKLLDRRALSAGKIQNQSSDDTEIHLDFDIYLNNLSPEP
ncbi:COP23 domain-containing protein [Calothrix sp. 336/3]|uniref:COP23 domain-containing protein n=1 Tax=Calothrix sp. 336/3 TaxID=1337936 RepID=UPI0004E297BF|nr:COP23 domain-containing protein [Calothrix sp. 336/3]AKG23728.1 hypothetical protein IJ00_22720 [Calothrix sp. 336/3]